MSREPNVIYVGRKPPMNYVLGIITGFSGRRRRQTEDGFNDRNHSDTRIEDK